MGAITALTSQVVPVPSDNLSGTGQVGSVTIVAPASVTVTGLSTSASVGSVLVYGNIIPAPGTSWSNITPNPNSTWAEIDPTQEQLGQK